MDSASSLYGDGCSAFKIHAAFPEMRVFPQYNRGTAAFGVPAGHGTDFLQKKKRCHVRQRSFCSYAISMEWFARRRFQVDMQIPVVFVGIGGVDGIIRAKMYVDGLHHLAFDSVS